MTERERIAGTVAGIRAQLIERGVIKNAKGMYICPICKKEVKALYCGKCRECDRGQLLPSK
jgi:hypothetical protein